MLSNEQLEMGGFRFEDLQQRRIVENRTDLLRKQTDLGFPLPIKTGASQAMFLKSEVYAWLRQRATLRDEKLLRAKYSGAQQGVNSIAPLQPHAVERAAVKTKTAMLGKRPKASPERQLVRAVR